MTKKRKIMFEDSLQKWKWIKDNWDYKLSSISNYGRLRKDLPFLTKYKYLCSFCDEYLGNPNYCQSCPILRNDQNCRKENSFYDNWEQKGYLQEDGKKYAENLYNLIKELYEKELKK
jgi:hypothetical protein